MGAEDRMWLTRARWRVRGAWQWPMLWALTLAGAVVLHLLPFSGTDGYGLIAGALVCGFANLAIVAGAGPLVAAWWSRRPRPIPRDVAADRASTAMMLVLFAMLLIAGVANRPAVQEADRDAARQLRAARAWFRANAPPQFVAGVGSENVLEEGADLFRTCIPGPDRHRSLCVFVDTSGATPTVREDSDGRPNSVVAGADNPGRR